MNKFKLRFVNDSLKKATALLGTAYRPFAEFEVFAEDEMPTTSDVGMMRRALALACEAQALGEVPVGSVVTLGGRIIAEAFNLRETLNDPTDGVWVRG